MNFIGILAAAFEYTLGDEGPSYFARPAGSSVEGLHVGDGEAVVAFLKQHNWTEVTDEAETLGVRFGGCRYYRATISAPYVGQEGIALASELTDDELAGARVVRGHHGKLELQLQGLKPRPTTVMHIIVGSASAFPHGDVTAKDAQVVTWYPGRLTASVDIGGATVKRAR